jgi:hypothetical protein
MPALIKPQIQGEIRVPLRVPFWGEEGDAVDRAIPELGRYLKSRYPGVKQIRIVYKNPRPELLALLHDVWIVVLPFTPFARKMQELLAEDIHAWMKKRFKTIKKGDKSRQAVERGRRHESNRKPNPQERAKLLRMFLRALATHEGARLWEGRVAFYDHGPYPFSHSPFNSDVFQAAIDSEKTQKRVVRLPGTTGPHSRFEIITVKRAR